MKRYAKVEGELERRIVKIRKKHHTRLDDVTICPIWVYDVTDDGEELAALEHSGYPAAAVVKLVPVLNRVAGLADVLMLIDKVTYADMNERQRDALVDHELTHLEVKTDPDTRDVLFDVAGRPRMKLRKHDRYFGWFDEVAKRWGVSSIEVRQARTLLEQDARQLYLDLPAPKAVQTN